MTALIEKKKTDKKNEFIILEHKLSVLYVPNRAIKRFLRQSAERNELLFNRMFDGTLINSLNIRLLRSINGFMLRGVRDRVDLGVASLNQKHVRKLRNKN